jgi:phosphate:Na+ symporter
LTPLAAEEAVRRTIARSLGAVCGSVGAALTTTTQGASVRAGTDAVSVTAASEALRQARAFISEASGPPESEEEEERLTSTLHALDHASRLAEVAGEKGDLGSMPSGPEDAGAAELCAEAMRGAVSMARGVDAPPSAAYQPAPVEALGEENELAAPGATEPAMAHLERCATALAELQRAHRAMTFRSVAAGTVSADEAIARVDHVRRLEALARHAWRSAAHLVESVA